MVINEDMFLFGVICIIPLIILGSDEKRQKAINMLSSYTWISQFLLLMIFMCYVLFINKPADDDIDGKNDAIRMRKAVYQGAIAFVIAICAAFDLTIAPFWLVFLSAFFFAF